MESFPFTKLVIEGGGSRGLCMVGVIKVLEEYGIIQNIMSIAGTSIGALIAGLISVGYTYKELHKILCDFNIENFLDASIIPFKDVHSLINYYGLYNGDVLRDFIEDLLYKKTGIKDITFKQLYELNNKILVIVGSNLTKQEVEYFNYIDTPDMQLSLAIRISSSIPGIFKAINYNDNLYIDGGLVNNYPIWVFDDPKYKETRKGDTIGIKFINDQVIQEPKINNILDFSASLITTPSNVLYKLYNTDELYIKRTVYINVGNIVAHDFSIDINIKNWLIKQGITDITKFLNNYLNEYYLNEYYKK